MGSQLAVSTQLDQLPCHLVTSVIRPAMPQGMPLSAGLASLTAGDCAGGVQEREQAAAGHGHQRVALLLRLLCRGWRLPGPVCSHAADGGGWPGCPAAGSLPSVGVKLTMCEDCGAVFILACLLPLCVKQLYSERLIKATLAASDCGNSSCCVLPALIVSSEPLPWRNAAAGPQVQHQTGGCTSQHSARIHPWVHDATLI